MDLCKVALEIEKNDSSIECGPTSTRKREMCSNIKEHHKLHLKAMITLRKRGASYTIHNTLS